MDQIPKIVITAEADQHLETMLKDVNDGFVSGRVKKAQLASWLILYFNDKLFRRVMGKIRSDHFDRIAHLKTVVKQMEDAQKNNKTLEVDKMLTPLFAKEALRAAKKRKADPSGLKTDGRASNNEERE